MAFLNDNAIWLIAALVIGIVAIVWIWQLQKPIAHDSELHTADASVETSASIETVEAPPASAPAPAGDLTTIGIPVAIGPADNLLLLKGVGPKLNNMLTGFGITRFDQIAAWDDTESATVDGHLGTFQGRIARDNWIEQAGLLASGDIAAFEAKFGKLDGQTA